MLGDAMEDVFGQVFFPLSLHTHLLIKAKEKEPLFFSNMPLITNSEAYWPRVT